MQSRVLDFHSSRLSDPTDQRFELIRGDLIRGREYPCFGYVFEQNLQFFTSLHVQIILAA